MSTTAELAANDWNPSLDSTPIRPNLTKLIWGICWEKFFPMDHDGISIDVCRYESIWQFMQKNFSVLYPRSFEQANAFLWVKEDSHRKTNFYREVADCFLFEHEGQPVGFFLGNAIDWGSYYLRHCTILPEYRGRKVFQGFLTRFLECLAHFGVDRVEVDVTPANQTSLHVHTKLDFKVTGYIASERWGNLIHLTRHFSESHRAFFLDRFCKSP